MPYKITNVTDKLINSDAFYRSVVNFSLNNADYTLGVGEFIFIPHPILTPKINILLLKGQISIETISNAEFQTILGFHAEEAKLAGEEIEISSPSIDIDEIIDLPDEPKEEIKPKKKNEKNKSNGI